MNKKFNPSQGISTLVNHASGKAHALNAHVEPIYQTSTFGFPDTETGAAIFAGAEGYVYTRWENPNSDQLADKIAILEGLDLSFWLRSPQPSFQKSKAGKRSLRKIHFTVLPINSSANSR